MLRRRRIVPVQVVHAVLCMHLPPAPSWLPSSAMPQKVVVAVRFVGLALFVAFVGLALFVASVVCMLPCVVCSLVWDQLGLAPT